MKTKLFFISLINLNIFCAQVKENAWKYYKIVGGYEKHINKFVVAQKLQDFNLDSKLIEAYVALNPPKEGTIFRGFICPNSKTGYEYLFKQSWLQDIEQNEGRILYNIQMLQFNFDEWGCNLYVKIVRGPYENKIIRVNQAFYLNHKFITNSNRFVYSNDIYDENLTIYEGLLDYRWYYFSENDIEIIDQETGKIEFENQLRAYFQRKFSIS